MKIKIFLLCFFIAQELIQAASISAPFGRVTAAIVDVRAHPSRKKCGTHSYHDFNQTTQLLWGEQVHIHAKKKGWVNVKIPEQSIFCKKQKKLTFCSGWIESHFLKESNFVVKPIGFVKCAWAPLFSRRHVESTPVIYICMGTPLVGFRYNEQWWSIETPDNKKLWISHEHVCPIGAYSRKKDKKKLRKSLVREATTFLGYPYRWGGRSMNCSRGVGPWLMSGVDCSSLIHLLYQSHGIIVPRNSTGLYHAAKAIHGKACKPGDLVFLSRNDEHNIYHVLLYLGDNQLLEASGDSKQKKVRIISASKKLGQEINSLKNGQTSGKHSIFLGTFLT